MSESTTSIPLDRLTSSQESLTFDPIELPEGAVRGADSAEDIQNTEQISDGERLVFPDEKRGDFEITNPDQAITTRAESSMLDDAWLEQVRERRRAAAEEAEARAEELDLANSISANAQAITATRDFVAHHGMNAEL